MSQLAKDAEIKTLAIKRLAETAQNWRSAIKYRFEFAENLSDDNKTEAATVIGDLVQQFPTNYGVLSEASNFYWRINRRADAVSVLRTAATRARGNYKIIFGRKLAARYLEQNDDKNAEKVLQKLYAENALDSGVYDELTNIYVRTGNRTALAEFFKQTLSEIKRQEIDFREITGETAELRTLMIAAFTRLKDYRAAVEQHIEIINREPDNEENVATAINYVRRYGAADVLADYYKKTAAQAYKNYRWFVVLAKIYEANKDLSAAAENYRIAINNQPEMLELYDALASVYERQGNYNAAIEILSKTLELSNDDPIRLKRIIPVFEKAGRAAEAAAARNKLPIAEKPLKPQSSAEQFAEAVLLQNTEKARAVEIAQNAFNALVQNPFANEIKTADLVAYVNIVRTAEPLDSIAQKLWKFRERLIIESEKADSTIAERARTARQILDGAITEAIGNVARKSATGTERSALFADLKVRIEKAISTSDDDGTISLLQSLIRKAGFEILEEQILIAKKDSSFAARNEADFHNHLNRLLGFYRERGAYKLVLELLETERQRDFNSKKFDYPQQIANAARLLSNRDKELAALREYFAEPCGGCLETKPDALVARYFEMLWESNAARDKTELYNLSKNPPARFQIQLINFLIGKNEKELARTAIQNSQFAGLWKQVRQAQTSFALNEFEDENESYFRAALGLKSIGELIGEKPNPQTQLVGDDWFRLTQNYGEWLYKSQKPNAVKFLSATIENRPHDAAAQNSLGDWYLEQKNFPGAIEHFELSLEIQPNNRSTVANLGAAYQLAGDAAKAERYWSQIISGDDPSFAEFELYTKTLKKYGRTVDARKRLTSNIIKKLNQFSARNAAELYGDDKEKFETLKKEVRLLANLFGDYERDVNAGALQASFFLKLSADVKENVLLPEFLVFNQLVAHEQLAPFYQLLIKRSLAESESDYEFTELLKTAFDQRIAEELLDQQENYQPKAPDSERLRWQKELLNWLISMNHRDEAREVVSAIKKEIARNFAHPVWLRLASWRLQIRVGDARNIMPELKRFVGVSISPDAAKIGLPNLERLNEAIKLLESENQMAEADELRTAFYARLLALEQFEATTFTELSKLQFKQGNASLGLKLLQLMTALTNNDQKEIAAAELPNLELIKIFAADAAKLEDVRQKNSLDAAETLEMADETAGKIGQFDAAIQYRQKLRALVLGDEINRIELARLFAEKQSSSEAIKILAEIIGDRLSLRKSRWQAILVAAGICGNNVDRWNQLKNSAPDLQTNDPEMWMAMAALELNQTGRTDEARGLLKAEQTSAELRFLNALFARQNGNNEIALSDFLAALKTDKNAEFAETFGFIADDPLRQTIDLYTLNGQLSAALQLAETDGRLKPAATIPLDGSYQTLAERAGVRETKSRVRSLKLLSSAAEQTKNFKLAAEFERARLNIISDKREKQIAETRIKFLLDRETAPVLATNFMVNQDNYSASAN